MKVNLSDYSPLDDNSYGRIRTQSTVEYIVIHCSATSPGTWLRFLDARTIDTMHREDRGWDGIGYHYVIKTDGTIEQGRRLHRQAAAARGYNDNWHICMAGGVDSSGKPTAELYTTQQWEALEGLVKALIDKAIDLFDAVPAVVGHNYFTTLKACPSFDVEEWWSLVLTCNRANQHQGDDAPSDDAEAAFGDGYEQGRTDTLNELIELLERMK